MPPEPGIKRAVAFFDGQNLFYAAKSAFGYHHPNYAPTKLAHAACDRRGWELKQTRFYTGVPIPSRDAAKHEFWARKLADMGKRGVITFSRPLRYRTRLARMNDGSTQAVLVGIEKGIDVRIALDVMRLTMNDALDVALIFSQDQNLSEVADEVRLVSVSQQRWIKVACAFPVGPGYANKRGINSTDWIRIDRETYDACIDPTDYRKNTK